MAIAQQNRIGRNALVLCACLASGLAVAVLGAAARTETAGFAVPAFAAHGVVLAQAKPDSEKKAQSTKRKRVKRRAIRCGAPGLAPCPTL
jgi:hypothetical protein